MAEPLNKTKTLMKVLRDRIASSALGPGDRMPSIRRFADKMGVSPSTVVEAYDRLAAEGIIRARRGSGFYVTRANLPPLNVAEMGSVRARNVDPFWVSRQSLDPRAGALQPGCGWLPEDWMPHDVLRKGLRALAKSDSSVLTNYASARGSPALRRYLLRRFSEENLSAAPEQVMLTASASQAMDLICRLLLRPGDTVLVDDPGYFNFHALLRAHQVQIMGIPYTPDGADLESLQAALKDNTPRLYITNCALHNPTGATLTPQTAYRLLSLAAAHDLMIVEDDTFVNLDPEPSPSLAVLDGLNRVVKIGGFSKTISASMRCGYIAGRQEFVEALVDLQVATSFGGPSAVATEVLAGVLTGGSYRKHLDVLHRRLNTARKTVIDRLAPLRITPWIVPRGGFYLWCRFPDEIDTSAIAQSCMDENVVLAPGNVFSPSERARDFMRFNVAQMSHQRIYSALQKAIEKLKVQ